MNFYTKDLCLLLEIDPLVPHEDNFVQDLFISKGVSNCSTWSGRSYKFNKNIASYIAKFNITNSYNSEYFDENHIKNTIKNSVYDPFFYDDYVCIEDKVNAVTKITIKM